MKEHIAVTVARQYGSGGREIGEKVASLLGYSLYDRELINMAAEAGNLHGDAAAHADEKPAGSLLYTLAMGSGLYTNLRQVNTLPLNDRLFVLQSDVIRSVNAAENAVFIGRSADYVLREAPGRFSVFIYADPAARIARIRERHPELDYHAAKDLMQKTDKRRSSYYNFYTGNRWGKYENYHLMLDSGVLGIEECAAVIAGAVEKFSSRLENRT